PERAAASLAAACRALGYARPSRGCAAAAAAVAAAEEEEEEEEEEAAVLRTRSGTGVGRDGGGRDGRGRSPAPSAPRRGERGAQGQGEFARPAVVGGEARGYPERRGY
ncbi:hypothetical protein HK405_010426, partial [Cladochytrium tenue]